MCIKHISLLDLNLLYINTTKELKRKMNNTAEFHIFLRINITVISLYKIKE